jgi:hypothetical protein
LSLIERNSEKREPANAGCLRLCDKYIKISVEKC